ncbi:hypothetical protein GGTG_03238 [Gaeumannomyces tritici R3-111a-1]|uniref:Urea active transporter n=1 Tax=Gaeumannomyces tritici (strain R3-111a-1) TaxID=644352 RepID=J3NPN1_GAET3|nr:hypothetical protein GGTG_03238 [Gaeumannomyces tritici R3-111a-1]EJT78136.1 hypothetical protein GGTG_03238 [Gaeumannomyces tritici R3-111a-1]
MAIMSTYSSELIAVSSICTYDIYKTYINPGATGKQLMRVNYIGMVCFALFFALFMAAFATALYYIGISMGYLYLMMGVIISSAALPATLTLMWSGQSWAAATFSPILGFACSVTVWLVTAKTEYGELSVAATGANKPMLAGNITSLLAPMLFIPLLTYIPPFRLQKYDWQSMLDIGKGDDREFAEEAHDPEVVLAAQGQREEEAAQEQAKLAKAAKIARWLTVVLTLALLVLWPMPMFGTGYIFSKEFFAGWVVVGIIWLSASAVMVVFLPVFESRSTIIRTTRMMFKDLFGGGLRSKPVSEGQVVSGDVTPPNASEKPGVKE